VKQTVYIADANILIDLMDLGLGRLWTRYFDCVTTPEVLDEVVQDETNDENSWLLDSSCLRMAALTEVDALSAISLQELHSSLSYPDCTVLVCAQSEAGIILSGDGPMRKQAASMDIELHGLLYVLNELFKLGELSGSQASVACRRWQELNPRTPTSKCDAYCRRWTE